ncbi:MAG: hypothetical protein J6W62_01830 [Spirochaetia bacterium]|nr:hypothetical protein [Spirochaetia bacterium]
MTFDFKVKTPCYIIDTDKLTANFKNIKEKADNAGLSLLMAMYFFKHLESQHFNYWSSIFVGITVLLRDILFPPPLESYPLHLVCLTLSVLLLLMLTFFYARKDWKSYTKRNLWMLFIIDSLIAGIYNYVIYHNPINEYTNYLLVEIWIRPTLIYGLVACFVSEKEEQVKS